jgi:hypothetical protein
MHRPGRADPVVFLSPLQGDEFMTSQVLHHSEGTRLSRWLIVGFISGAAAVLVFHQGAAALLHALDVIARPPYSMQPTRPWGVPQLWSITFWGAMWGAVLAAALTRLDGARLLLAALVFGAIFPTLVAWFVVAPLKGQPMAAGFVPAAMSVGPILNGAWGLGTGIGLAFFGRSGAHPTRSPRSI